MWDLFLLMKLLSKHLVAKKSKIPQAGKGLFTKIFISKGTRIVEYLGKIITWKDAVSRAEAENGYVFYVTSSHCIDAKGSTKSLAGLANDARGLVRLKGLTNNAEYVTEKKRCFIQASKEIQPGSEILVSYGKDYWAVIRHNKKIYQQLVKKKNLTRSSK